MHATSSALPCSTALPIAMQKAQAKRLTVGARISGARLMENARRPVAQATWPVRAALLVPRRALCGVAAHHAGLRCGPVEPSMPAALDVAERVVGAIFGAGLGLALDGAAPQTLAAAAAAAAVSRMTLIAVDVPGGLMGDTEACFAGPLGAVPSALTVTCFRKKPGHVLQPFAGGAPSLGTVGGSAHTFAAVQRQPAPHDLPMNTP